MNKLILVLHGMYPDYKYIVSALSALIESILSSRCTPSSMLVNIHHIYPRHNPNDSVSVLSGTRHSTSRWRLTLYPDPVSIELIGIFTTANKNATDSAQHAQYKRDFEDAAFESPSS